MTILFADVVGSTEMASRSDPEVVRSKMARYFDRISEVSAAYGGTVEKFAGDSAMVVFGVPAVHEDDAERAVRAALEIRDGAGELEVRVGVNSGEALTAARDDKQFMVSGDAVNVAARLQQGAEPGEVVVGQLTHHLTHNVIEYQDREPITAKGKREPLVAYRATRPRSHVPAQARGVEGLQAPLVGRDRELRLLLDTFTRSSTDRRSHLFTLAGPAGIGKSRLVSEALSALARTGAHLMRGRCLPYGRGVTYWPLMEMVMSDTGITRADEADAALARLERRLEETLGGDPQQPAVRARLAVMMGLLSATTAMPDTQAERIDREVGWAFRYYVDAIARREPVILVTDDVQWAEAPVLDTLEALAERSTDVPMLLICIARPEFLEHRRDWAAGKPNATTITLDPLDRQETSTLISRLLEIDALPAELRDQVIERSAGTPLFCEEFIQMLIDEGRLVRSGDSWHAVGALGGITVPHSIQAVLAARLDGLPEDERRALQAASVVGARFEAAEVRELIDHADPDRVLDSLRRKGLVTGGDGAGEEMGFRHILVRDAAYASLPKSDRATLHDRFGARLEKAAGDVQPLTEILAHHAERALTLSIELGIEADLLEPRARRALDWSLAAGDRAATRRDLDTLDAELRTAREASTHLTGEGGLASRAQLALLEAQRLLITADYPAAAEASAAAASLAADADLPATVARARLNEAWIANWAGMVTLEDFDRIVARAVEACRAAGDVAGEIEARHVGTNHFWATGDLESFISANQLLLDQARSIRDHPHVASILVRLTVAEGVLGNQSAAERHLAEAEALAASLGYRDIRLAAMMQRASRMQLMGDLQRSEPAFREFLAAAEEAGSGQSVISALRFLAAGLLYQRRPDEAAVALDRALDLSETTAETWNRSELLGFRSRASVMLGDLEGAELFINRALSSLREEDLSAVAEVYEHLGALRAAQGRKAEAEEALRQSLLVLSTTGYNFLKTQVSLALAKLLVERGAVREAATHLAQADRWLGERKTGHWADEFSHIRASIGGGDGAS